MYRKLRTGVVRFSQLLGIAVAVSYALVITLCLSFPESPARLMLMEWWSWGWDDLNMMALVPVALVLPAIFVGAMLPLLGMGPRSTLLSYSFVGTVGIGLAIAFLVHVAMTFEPHHFEHWQETYYFVPICEVVLVLSCGSWLRRSLRIEGSREAGLLTDGKSLITSVADGVG